VVDRWADFGWLDKAAAISFAGGLAGLFLTVVVGKLTGSGDAAFATLIAWFMPSAAWLLCFWAAVARENFGVTSVCLGGLVGLGSVLNFRPAEEVVLAIGASVLITGALAVIARPLVWLRELGRFRRA
jgi:hypothetical protein